MLSTTNKLKYSTQITSYVFFAHWSSTEVSYRDMESHQLQCERCNEQTKHTLRYHTKKTKHYSSFSFGEGDKSISVICHGCLLEKPIEKTYEKKIMERFDCEIATSISHELMENTEFKKAYKLLQKVLKKNPEYGPAVYAITKCSISQKKHDEANIHLKILEKIYPNNTEVEELRNLILTR